MPERKDVTDNDGIDAEYKDSVSYEPNEKDAESDAEKSDAQLASEKEPLTEAEGGNPSEKDPPDPDKKEEPEKNPDDPQKTGKPAAAPEKVQKRINKITREKYEAVREAERIKKENEELRKQLQETKAAKEKADLETQKPKQEDFDDEEAYHIALGRWAARVEISESKNASEPDDKSKKKEPEADTSTPLQVAFEAGRDTHDDFDEVVLNTSLKLTKEMISTFVDSECASEILYYLGSNPDESAKISEMSLAAQARAIGRIEAQFVNVDRSDVHKPEDDNEVHDPKNKSKNPSKAPAPIKPIGGGGKVVKDLEDMTNAEYRKRRGFDKHGMPVR